MNTRALDTTITEEAALWAATSGNRKTGNVPTLHIGRTRSESRSSCAGCPLLARKDGGSGEVSTCYAQYGTPARGHASAIKGWSKRPERYTIESALSRRSKGARMVRNAAIGDGGRLPMAYLRRVARMVRADGLAHVGYTHFWEGRESDTAEIFCASAGSIGEAIGALRAGMRRATAVVASDFLSTHGSTVKVDKTGRRNPSGGETAIVCPAIVAESRGRTLTCNECRLCDPMARGPRIVLFPDHGPQSRRK